MQLMFAIPIVTADALLAGTTGSVESLAHLRDMHGEWQLTSTLLLTLKVVSRR
jgi:hypothetical protein